MFLSRVPDLVRPLFLTLLIPYSTTQITLRRLRGVKVRSGARRISAAFRRKKALMFQRRRRSERPPEPPSVLTRPDFTDNLWHVLSFLDHSVVCTARGVCKTWCDLIDQTSHESEHWRGFVRSTRPFDSLTPRNCCELLAFSRVLKCAPLAERCVQVLTLEFSAGEPQRPMPSASAFRRPHAAGNARQSPPTQLQPPPSTRRATSPRPLHLGGKVAKCPPPPATDLLAPRSQLSRARASPTFLRRL